jgi:SpoVK/Ycf46/Vps4 family AAA+-type ATPase
VPIEEFVGPQVPRAQWSDVIVAADVRVQLDQALTHARWRTGRTPGRVPVRFRGYKLLLTGPPGTGKSMLAEAMAHALDAPILRLDLSSVLSRWLGETERSLAQMFEVAESADAVLALDEAEALLRQRDGRGGGEALGTAVAFMLTRIERYRGVLVATSNRISDLDEAFFRRFDDFVVLPVPDAATRARLWASLLPEDAEVDRELLASRFPIPGGLITGAVLRASAWAEAEGRPMRMPVVLASLARELEKSDRSPGEAMVEPWADDVRRLLSR